MTQLLLATGNPGKLRELKALLAHLPLRLVDTTSLTTGWQIQETESSYSLNASLKAAAAMETCNCWALADDSGLEVDALGGAPGPTSARLAGPGASDADRRHALLQKLRQHPRPWKARFRCVAALAGPGGTLDFASGTCEGDIIPEERGTEGFGYDPIFRVQGTGRTMAELPLAQKNHLSHRARAIRALLPVLRMRLVIE